MTETFTDETLEATPARVTKLLSGMAGAPTIRTLLFQAGMTDLEVEDGLKLLLAVLAQPAQSAPETDTEAAQAQRAALAALDAWDEPNFARAKATLRRRFPSAAEYVFGDLSARSGAESVTAVATYCARVTALAMGTDPARTGHSREDDQAAALLESRGLGMTQIAELQKLVRAALGPTPALAVPLAVVDPDARRQKLSDLKSWYDEWATTANAVIKKRQHLIRLGLAHPRRKKATGSDGDTTA